MCLSYKIQLNCGDPLASRQHGKARCNCPERLDKLMSSSRGVRHQGEDTNYTSKSPENVD